jgi:hypothetical protein
MQMNKTTLWQLRTEIVLNSLFMSDYQNSFGFTTQSVFEFFDGYMSYLEELMGEDGVSDSDVFNVLGKYDTIDNLCAWWNTFGTYPLEKGE